MSDRVPIPLFAYAIPLDSPEFAAICGWPFVDPYVTRLLRDDIPQRVQFNECYFWVYREPAGCLAGFGTIDVCQDYEKETGGRPHTYIPLLAVNPTVPSRGYGTSIVRHLIGEAVLLAAGRPGCDDRLFLDVYTTNTKAIQVYTDCHFVTVSEAPRPDPREGGNPYIVMARRVSVAPPNPPGAGAGG